MATTTENRAEETSLGWEPDELRAHPHNMHALLFAVSEAFERRLGRRDTESRAGRFRVHLARSYERLERINRETGPGVEEGALRDALPELERAYDTIGAHIEGVDDLTRSAGHEVNTPVCDLFYAAGITLEWALTGCRARLAEMEEEPTPRENGDGGGCSGAVDFDRASEIDTEIGYVEDRLAVVQSRLKDAAHGHDLDGREFHGLSAIIADIREGPLSRVLDVAYGHDSGDGSEGGFENGDGAGETDPERRGAVVRLARLALAASEVAVRSVPETLERRRCACIRLEAEVEDAVADAFEALGVEETDVFYSHVRERAAEVFGDDSSGEGESRE